MSFIKVGFKLFNVLKISIQRLRSLVTFLVLLPASFRIDSYEDHNYHIENEKIFFGDRIFVKKRYGKTRVGGFLFSVRVELPFFIPHAF